MNGEDIKTTIKRTDMAYFKARRQDNRGLDKGKKSRHLSKGGRRKRLENEGKKKEPQRKNPNTPETRVNMDQTTLTS